MSKLNKTLQDDIAQSCLNLFHSLPKTGKPVEKEWTVLSCIVKYDQVNKHIEVVSLGTGSKCIGATLMSSDGSTLNDSHAEVIARRGFLVYLYHQIENTWKNKWSIFKYENSKFKLKDNIEFIFYSSQLPCGDASIIPKSGEEENFGDVLKSIKRQAEDGNEENEVEKKRQKFDKDVHRTGAKCLPNSIQDSKQRGCNYHVVGQVRTKPGRGDRTLSVSCSDKIGRWIHLGVQGALLDMLLTEPIYIHHFIFGSEVPYSEEALNRAMLNRHSGWSNENLKVVPEFYKCSHTFDYKRSEVTVRAAHGSILWVKLDNPLLEVAVQGKKMGVTKKRASLLSSSLSISKFNLYKRFLHILYLDKSGESKKILFRDIPKTLSYNEMKKKSKRYLNNWAVVKENFFKMWTVKPDMWNFCVDLDTA